MYKIIELKIKNFIIFDNIDIKFDNSKLYIIQGRYNNNKNRSNGSGKTAFIQAIIFGIFGITFRNIIKTKKKETQVYIKLQNEQNDIIEILRSKKNNSISLKLKINNKIKSFTKKKDKQKYLNSILLNNMNSEIYFRTVFFANYINNLHFINLTPSKQINVVESLLNFTILDDIYNKIREKEQKLKYDIEKIQSNIKLLKKEFDKNKKIKNEFISNTIILKEQQEIDNLKNKIINLNGKIDQIKSKINNIKTTNLTEHILSEIKNTRQCPVCHSILNKNEINKLNNEYNKSKKFIQLKENLEYFTNQKTQMSQLLSFKLLNMKKLNKVKDNENIINKKKINNINNEIIRYTKLVEEKNEKLEMYNYLHNIFNTRSKIRTNIIRDYLKLLSEQTLLYLKQYDPTINNFDMFIENNELKKLSTLKIVKDNIDISNLSEGEKTKIQISLILSFIYMLFTIYKCNLGIIFFDEIFNTLDQETLDITLNILNSFANENKFQIFIITHNKINNNMFDKIIEIQRYTNYSTINMR